MSDPFAEFDTPRPGSSPRRDARAADAAGTIGETAGTADETVADSVMDPETDVDEAVATVEPAHERRRRWPGYWSFGVAAGMVLVTIVAITLASMGDAVTALTLTASGLALAGIAIVLGLVSIFGRYARPWGIAGLAVGLLINPLVLLYGLSAMGMY